MTTPETVVVGASVVGVAVVGAAVMGAAVDEVGSAVDGALDVAEELGCELSSEPQAATSSPVTTIAVRGGLHALNRGRCRVA
jgi:hypothetical protein